MSAVGKLGETIIKNGIGIHVDRCTLPWKRQHGFYKGNYCLENLLEIFERVSRHMDKTDLIDIIYLDLDIKQPCIRDKKVISWINNWLQDRQQWVGVNSQFSQWREVSSRIPQGNVQGIVLLNMVISDLYNGVSSDVRNLDDDTKLFRVAWDLTTKNCRRLEWEKWKRKKKRQMKFCIAKCKMMRRRKDNPSFIYKQCALR